jgi:hypothetical protein
MTDDARPRVPLNGKMVNLAQLSAEVGTALSGSDSEVVIADPDSPITAAQLQAALAAHIPLPPPPTFEQQIVTLKAQIDSLHAADGAFLDLIDRMV